MQLTVCSLHAGDFQQTIRELFFSYSNSLFTISTNAYLETYLFKNYTSTTEIYTLSLPVSLLNSGHFQQKIRELCFSYCNSLFTISTNAYLETYCIQQFWCLTRLSNHATN